eukprot:scaffold9613_cov18-Tisochrysis_lutea.AAC.7
MVARHVWDTRASSSGGWSKAGCALRVVGWMDGWMVGWSLVAETAGQCKGLQGSKGWKQGLEGWRR